MVESSMIINRNTSLANQDEWENINPEFKEMANKVAISINEAHNKIAKAKKLAKDAQNIKGGFLGIGKQKKVNTSLSESQIITNEALTDLSELIQQSIRFTLQSVKTASNMQKALAYVAVNGIRDTNGRVEDLSAECAESIDLIIESAQDFLQQQSEFSDQIEAQFVKDREQDEELYFVKNTLEQFADTVKNHELWISNLQKKLDGNQAKIKEYHNKLESLIENNQKMSEKRLTDFEKKFHEITELNKKLIQENMSAVESIQKIILEDKIVNDQRIIDLDNTMRELIESYKQEDENERLRLKNDYYSNVNKMKMSLIVSTCSVGLIAVASLIVSFLF
ncbi:hypothetical protein [Paenibacillus xylanexedens]|uniref:hypothetical protein n=1 Tax=Paenibacillus xylanexedens TaxID=528191 RepID=UPI0011A85E87|nr:hypothetical protein [Paenibacillus xylanexedens]